MTRTHKWTLVWVLAASCVAIIGCPPVSLDDDDDGSGPTGVDVLWIVDSSNSMHDN